MKQNSQWLSQVRTRSKIGDGDLEPERLAVLLFDRDLELQAAPDDLELDDRPRPPSSWYSMTSRGTRPFIERSSSPGQTPARSAGECSATATTCGRGMSKGYPGLP